MNCLKQFVGIFLFIFCVVLVVKCFSANRLKGSKLVKKHLEGFGKQQNHEASKRVMINEVDKSILASVKKERHLKVKNSERRLFSNSRGLHNEFFIRQRRDINDGFTPQGTKKVTAKTREILLPEVVTGSRNTNLQFNHVLKRWPLKLKTINNKQSTGFDRQSNLDQTLNQKNEGYNEIVSSHRIVKRNVKTTQPSIPSTTTPPIIILPPPPLPPPPSFNIPPVCSGQQSCFGRCTGNATEFRSDENLACYCDTACYEIFNDCCTDYTKYCGVQKPSDVSVKKFNWTCEPLGHFRSNQNCLVSEGIWVISRCADDWSSDEIRSKCEDPTRSPRQASDIGRYIPAVSGNLTFRNYFCAICNHIDEDFEYFPVEIKTNVIPPEHYNFSQKVNFLLLNGAEFPVDGPERPKSHQKRRYCQKSIVQSCPGNTTSEPCTNGPVALVSGFGRQFKNYECALCNEPSGIFACFPSFPLFNCKFNLQQKFSLKLDYQQTNQEQDSTFTLLKEYCSNGLVYNDKLQDCAENLPPPSGKEDVIRVLAWFSPSKDFQFTEQDFKTIMKQYFEVNDSQVYNISIETVPGIFLLDPTPDTTILYHMVSSTLYLTAEQSFDILFKMDSSSSRLNLRSFIHFDKPLGVTLNNITYTVIKTTSRPLSCITRKVYTPQDYTVLDDQRITIKSTDIIYKKWEYYGQINGNVTVCEKYSASKCEKIQTGLSKNDFIINTNLSLYHKDTGALYELGKYDGVNNSIALCNLQQSDIPTCPNENSCQGRCINHTQWRTEIKLRCSCDPDCYEVFNDCCADYTKYCGAQKPKKTLTKKYNYTCERIGHYNAMYCTVGEGLWMVTRCRPDWPDDTLRAKCEAPVNQLSYSTPDLHGYLPVVGEDNTTFRNMYCARCNNVEKFGPWPLDIHTTVLPPENYNITDKIRFLSVHGAQFPPWGGPWRPGTNQARRYCFTGTIDYCPIGKTDPSCNNGDVALISYGNSHFKNTNCATCHGLEKEMLTCFTGKIQQICRSFFPQSFSLVLDNTQAESEIQTQVSIHDEKCGNTGMIFDDILQVCRVNWASPPEQSMQARFYVYAWLAPPSNSENNSFTAGEFRESLSKHLNISQEQLSNVNLTIVLQPKENLVLFYVVSSTIVLTTRQSLELSSQNRNDEIPSSETKIHNYIYFSNVFTLEMRGLMYSVAKTTSRPLACVGKTTYTPVEYTLLDHGRVFVPTINKTYERFEYYRESIEQLETKRSNITVCQSHVLAKCNGSIVLYEKDEYTLFSNLSIYVNETSSSYNYGAYEILPNASIEVCQTFKVHIIAKARQTIREDLALGYITFISFLLSILCLIFLLVTYILFPQLRTLPGKNLMNFAATLLFFMVFWLPSSFSEVRSDKPSCTAMAIMEHYFLMALFVSMSVIAFHTCKVFARNLPAPKMSEGHERKMFCAYLASVWILPGVFVAICVVLDNQDVVKLGYGESEICWLTENNAYTYFVTIPIAVLSSFNIIAFVITAVYLRKHGQNTAAKQASGNRRSNLSIYVKLSTLMGFTWLFGLLALVVTSTTVFWYFFVILTSLQGVFVAVAFVLNAKTFSLYRQGYQKYNSSSRTPITTRRNITTNTHRDTKL